MTSTNHRQSTPAQESQLVTNKSAGATQKARNVLSKPNLPQIRKANSTPSFDDLIYADNDRSQTAF